MREMKIMKNENSEKLKRKNKIKNLKSFRIN